MKRAAKKVSRPSPAGSLASLPVRGHRVGRIVEFSEHGWSIECAPGSAPLLARTTLALSAAAMRAAAETRTEALIVFENEAADKPIVVGLLAPAPALEVDATVATLDGRRVTLEGQEEVMLRCGDASITLRRNGRVVIRGTYVETRSQGVNRIKGGSVQIN